MSTSHISKLAERMLVVLYLMSDGEVGVPIRREELFARCKQLRIDEMSDEKFDSFHRKVLRAVRAKLN